MCDRIESFRCPACGRVSYHPGDVRNRFCAACKRSFEVQKKIPLEAALEIANAADLPDGAWWAMLEDLTGLDVGEIAEVLKEDVDVD